MPGSLQVSPVSVPPRVVLLIGASGFVGSSVLQALRADQGTVIKTLTRTADNSRGTAASGTQPVVGDIGDHRSLMRALEGVDVVVNAASYVGPDPNLAEMGLPPVLLTP